MKIHPVFIGISYGVLLIFAGVGFDVTVAYLLQHLGVCVK